MNKPFPIKVETFVEAPYKLVEWKLHDKCNYNCSFCGDENKLGIFGWQDLETNKKIVDGIVNGCKGKPYWIQLTGGEPTLYPKFLELVTYMKQQGAMIRLISNASRTIRWWKEVRDAGVLDIAALTFHSEQQADYRHIAEVSNLFLDEETITVIPITYVPGSLEYALEGAKYLTENTGSYISMNAMDLRNKTEDAKTFCEESFEEVLTKYNLAYGELMDKKKPSPIPKEFLSVNHTTVTYNDGSSELKDVTLMMKTGENKFEGWLCHAGMDSINIEPNMKFRGGCKRGGTNMEKGSFSFFDKPFVCDIDACFCAMDMITTKIRISD